MSSNDCRRAASISRTASPRLPMTSASDSALSRKVSLTLLPRWTMVSVMRAPVCSSLDTTSPPRRLRSSTSESPVVLSVEFTSSTRLEMVSASWLPVSTTSSVSSCVRSVIMSRIAADFCAKPSVDAVEPHRHHVLQVGGDLGELVADVVGLEIQRRGQPVAGAGDRLRGCPSWSTSRRSSRSPPRSPSCLDHGVAGVAERARDVLALLGQRHA